MKASLSAKHLTHPHQPFYGCTLKEAMLIWFALMLVFELVAVSVMCFTGYLFIPSVIGTFLSLIHLRFFLKKLGAIKKNKPYGHFEKLMYDYAARLGLMKSPYFQHQGGLSTRSLKR